MAHEVECTHCHVLMTSWSAAGSPVRYWQCPFCGRTHSSLYSEVFQRGAGARRVDPASNAAAPQGAPQASAEDIQRGRLKARAALWFARLEQEQVVVPPRAGTVPRPVGADARLSAAAGAGARRR